MDCDLHHARKSNKELLPYLSPAWREYVTGRGRAGPVPLTTGSGYYNPHGFQRADAFPASGGDAGSDYELVREQVLDRLNVTHALLTFGDDIDVSGHHSPYFAAELARALNDWTAENWLARDDRLYGSILVANQLPDLAAKEVRRHRHNRRMAQILLADNAQEYAFGHPLHHPIYEAALELGLPIAIHAGAGGGPNPASAAGGHPTTYMEFHALWPQTIMTHLVSFMVHGVFEKYPDLKLILIEGGVAWVPTLLWRMDSEYKGLRREVPWMTKLPSEYFHEHVWCTTQPLESSPKRAQLIQVLESIDARGRLLFATDYPHWDADEVDYVATRLPSEWHDDVFHGNAMRLYGWDEPNATGGPSTT